MDLASRILDPPACARQVPVHPAPPVAGTTIHVKHSYSAHQTCVIVMLSRRHSKIYRKGANNELGIPQTSPARVRTPSHPLITLPLLPGPQSAEIHHPLLTNHAQYPCKAVDIQILKENKQEMDVATCILVPHAYAHQVPRFPRSSCCWHLNPW